MLFFPSEIILVGREGFQPRPLFQEDCQIRWRADDPLGIYCFLCGIHFLMLLFYLLIYFVINFFFFFFFLFYEYIYFVSN
jgi:hypothetical protein